MRKVRWLIVVGALAAVGVARAQDAEPAPAAASDLTNAESQPVAEQSAPTPSPVAQAVPSAGPAAQPAPASQAVPTQATASESEVQATPPVRPRVVLLSPRKYAVRPRPPRVYGDAGAPFMVGLGASFGWPSDPGYTLVGLNRSLARLELFGAYDVWQPVRRVVVSAGGSFRTLLGADEPLTRIEERAIQADLSARYALTGWLFPHVRASFGAVGTRLTLEDSQPYQAAGATRSIRFEDTDWAPMATLGAGITLRTKARAFETYRGHLSALSLGVSVEGGYSVAQAAELKLRPESSPASGVSLSRAQIGSLDRSAPYLRVAGVIRF